MKSHTHTLYSVLRTGRLRFPGLFSGADRRCHEKQPVNPTAALAPKSPEGRLGQPSPYLVVTGPTSLRFAVESAAAGAPKPRPRRRRSRRTTWPTSTKKPWPPRSSRRRLLLPLRLPSSLRLLLRAPVPAAPAPPAPGARRRAPPGQARRKSCRLSNSPVIANPAGAVTRLPQQPSGPGLSHRAAKFGHLSIKNDPFQTPLRARLRVRHLVESSSFAPMRLRRRRRSVSPRLRRQLQHRRRRLPWFYDGKPPVSAAIPVLGSPSGGLRFRADGAVRAVDGHPLCGEDRGGGSRFRWSRRRHPPRRSRRPAYSSSWATKWRRAAPEGLFLRVGSRLPGSAPADDGRLTASGGDATLGLAPRAPGGAAVWQSRWRVYQKFLRDYPNDRGAEIPAVYLELGRALRALGSQQQAIASFYSVINATLVLTDNNFANYRQLAKTAQFEIAETMFEAGDFAEASRFFARLKLLDLAPADRALAQFKSADALYLAEDFDGAIVGLRAFVDQNPDDENGIPRPATCLADEPTAPPESVERSLFAITLEISCREVRAPAPRPTRKPGRIGNAGPATNWPTNTTSKAISRARWRSTSNT